MTLGFPFRPYRGEKSIVDGATIRRYVEETARHFGIDEHIRYGHNVVATEWSSGNARWTVTSNVAGERVAFTCGFLYACAGYYDYTQGYAPERPGLPEFGGRLVYPQFWPHDFDVTDKRVVVIGSGATAVTLVPALSQDAAHVTMLQRSPSYIVSLPSSDEPPAKLAVGFHGASPRRRPLEEHCAQRVHAPPSAQEPREISRVYSEGRLAGDGLGI